MRIGVIGGTFDPIHNAHLVIAEEARARLNLAEVLFVPAGQPWLKATGPISAAEYRLEMVRLALADRDHSGPSYAVDTIAKLQSQLGTMTELFFILGWDSLAELPQWHEPARLVEMCYLVAVPRPGYSRPKLKVLKAAIPGLSQRVMFMENPEIAVSASEIRERVARGLSVRHLVPEPVNRYIKQQKLYVTR